MRTAEIPGSNPGGPTTQAVTNLGTVIDMPNMLTNLVFRIAKRWVAGETYQDAIARATQSNQRMMHGILNLLGEDVLIEEEIAATTMEYDEILSVIGLRKLQCCISIKPSQLGLAISKPLFVDNLKKIIVYARSQSNFVWLDMEGSRYTNDTVETYLDFRQSFENIGIAIQANLKRSEQDVSRILDSNGTIRLVKGAYNESSTIAYKKRWQIRENFAKLMSPMFQKGGRFAIATHDEKLIEEAIRLSGIHHTDFEFQMLLGIRDKKKLGLVQRGFRLGEYIPFGKDWYAYSLRRIREHKSNVILLARSLVST